jgi:hypothetical protein
MRSKVGAYGSADDGERRSGDGCGSFSIGEPVMMIAFMCFNQPETYGVFRDYTNSIEVVGSIIDIIKIEMMSICMGW